MKSGIRAIDFMNHKVITVTPDMTVKEAAKLMNVHRVGGVPVCEGKELLGLLTERDIMMRVTALDKLPSSLKVGQVMQSPLKAIGEKFEDLSSLARKMSEHKISKIPIVEDGKLIGIVTDGDIREAGPSDVSSLGKYETDFLLSGLKVSDVMTNEPVTVSSGDTIRKLAELMLVRKIGGVPVVDDGELVGIITVSDIFKVILETFED